MKHAFSTLPLERCAKFITHQAIRWPNTSDTPDDVAITHNKIAKLAPLNQRAHMGLMDRDYMHERHRRQPRGSTSAGSSKSRIVWWTIGICAALYLAVKYLVLPAGGLPFPHQGQVLWYIDAPGTNGAPLTIKAPARGDKLHAVRINEAVTGRLIGLVPLRVGETVSVNVPLGAYEFVFASGRSWHGPEKLFGFTGKKTKTAAPLHFYRTGNQTMGHTIDLTQRVDGSLPTRALAPFER